MGKGSPVETGSAGLEADSGGAAFPKPRRITSGVTAAIPKASRQPPGQCADHPTISGAAVETSEAIMFDSDKATARCSRCQSESAAGAITRISEPINPMQNAAPIVING